MDSLGVCVVGAGQMGAEFHAPAWEKVPGAKVVSVCDISEERAAEVAAKHGAAHTADFREAIEREDVNVVSVCVPACLHADVTVFAAEHGRQVLCEKPIALTLADADRMARAAEAGGVKLMIGLCHRFFRTQQKAMELVAAGAVGSPRHYHRSAVAGVRPKIAMHDRAGNGGPIVDVMCHFIDDMCRVLGSTVTRVYAAGHTFAQNHPSLESIKEKAVDTAAVLLEFANGDSATYSTTWGAPSGVVGEAQQQVWGPDGFMRINVNDSVELIQSDRRVLYERLKVNQIDREVAHFAACIREDKPVEADAATGRRLLEVALAALESIETHGPVDVGA